MKIIYQTPDKVWRIIQEADAIFQIEDLKGDVFKPEVCPEIPSEKLKLEEIRFEQLVEREGVYGFKLEKWDATPGAGYQHIDSCWGFVGEFNPNEDIFNHYIVEELKGQIK